VLWLTRYRANAIAARRSRSIPGRLNPFERVRHQTLRMLSLRSPTLLAALVSLFLGTTACDLGTHPSPEAVRATTQTSHQLVEKGATLLDVRTPGEFASGHISGAVNIPLNDLSGRIQELREDQAIVVYCRSGRRSAIAAKLLREHGVGTVSDLGAMSNW
jgi:phage shock protein E